MTEYRRGSPLALFRPARAAGREAAVTARKVLTRLTTHCAVSSAPHEGSRRHGDGGARFESRFEARYCWGANRRCRAVFLLSSRILRRVNVPAPEGAHWLSLQSWKRDCAGGFERLEQRRFDHKTIERLVRACEDTFDTEVIPMRIFEGIVS
jgi:hypothetical protein